MSEDVNIKINPADLMALLKTFNKMGKAANKDLRDASWAIAKDVASEITASATGASATGGNPFQAQAVATGVKPYRDRLAKIKISGKRQVASGGATVEDLLWGAEFGSNKYKQFKPRTPKTGRGNVGYFIFPTLKRLQPKIRRDWIKAVEQVADIWRKANG